MGINHTFKRKNSLRRMLQNSNKEISIKIHSNFPSRKCLFKYFRNLFFSFSYSQGPSPSNIFSSFSNFQSTTKYCKILVHLQKITNSQVCMRKLISLNSIKELSDPFDQVIRTNQFLFVTYAMK